MSFSLSINIRGYEFAMAGGKDPGEKDENIPAAISETELLPFGFAADEYEYEEDPEED